jgi:acetyl esterase/lipase
MRRRSLLTAAATATLLPLARAGSVLAELPITTELDVVYGTVGGEALHLDIYHPPARAELRPAIVLLHPGAWTCGQGDRRLMEEPARLLAAAGYVAFNVDYRLTSEPCGDHVWPDQLDDVQRAVRWVRSRAEHYGVDPARVGAYGHSAGGHLAAMLGVRETRDDSDPTLAGISSRVACVVALAGHFDLSLWYPQGADRQSVVRLLVRAHPNVLDALHDASPLTWVNPHSAPFLVIHGGADAKNPVAHARRMVDALHAAGVEVVYAELPQDNHFSVAAWPVAGPWALTFFAVHLRPED